MDETTRKSRFHPEMRSGATAYMLLFLLYGGHHWYLGNRVQAIVQQGLIVFQIITFFLFFAACGAYTERYGGWLTGTSTPPGYWPVIVVNTIFITFPSIFLLLLAWRIVDFIAIPYYVRRCNERLGLSRDGAGAES